MAKRMRLELSSMKNSMGFRMKVIERTGTKLKDLFSPTNMWKGESVNVTSAQLAIKGGRTCQIAREGVLYMKVSVPSATLGR